MTELPKNLILDKDQKWEITHFDEITNFLWKNRKKILEMPDGFEYPDYGGLPKRLWSKLGGDFVDAIQMAFYEIKNNKNYPYDYKVIKKEFCRDCAKYLFAI